MGPARLWIVLATAAAAVVVAVASLYGALWVAFGICGGDGGYPYADEGSEADRFCDSAASVPYVLALLVLPPIVVVALGVVAAVRRRWQMFGLGLAIGTALVVVMTVAISVLPS